ncbi:structural maintenance of chromosomes protein 5 [Bicyclus anynana]|uniref:Structural maintenance of chromosomes protein 5 n=1 Tax=Bicyclus anynana TaxID=110368 RepID=A0ABM3LSC6_BICAN|nr:structural maintenance of chromosomes protein 5 [Bicyclus anynana]
MSQVVNTGGMRAGCIYRISLKNFITYKEVTLHPGKSLNLIIGPNGTGKSTIVSAIILGLGGSPKAIGKDTKLEQFVKTGTKEATIDIELYQNPGQRNVIITMTFNRSGAPSWRIDNRPAEKKRVQALIASLHIQVENLCQFLPQHKVHEFAAKLPSERLRDTLATVGPPGSVEQLDELKTLRAEKNDVGTRLQSNKKELQGLESRHNMLQKDIEALQERKEKEKEIELCKVKKLWLDYQKLKKDVAEHLRESKEQASKKKQIDRVIAPLETDLENVKGVVNVFERKQQTINTEIHKVHEQVSKIMDSISNNVGQLELIESAFMKKVERHKNRKKELIEEKSKLDKLNMDKTSLRERLGDPSNLQADLNKTLKQISVTSAQCKHLRSQKLDAQYEIDQNITPQLRQHQNRIRRLEDVNEIRLRTLADKNEDTYNAVMWLRDNMNKFQHPVYEPMMLQINFTDPKYAQYLEATVSARDLIAFTFECKDDMNLFSRSVRSLNMRMVNAVHSRGAPEQSDDIRRLSYLGFQTYLVDTIKAPDPILRFLCKQYKIHKIPIGNQHTYDNFAKVPPNITKFFTERHIFTIRVSAYSGAKSSSTREIKRARLLANTIDLEQIYSLQNELTVIRQSESVKRADIQRLDTQLQDLENNLRDLSDTRKNIEGLLKQISLNGREIKMQMEKITDLTNECTFDLEAEKAACRAKRKESVVKQRKLHQELLSIVKVVQKKMISKELCSVKLKISRDSIVDKEATLRQHKEKGREMEDILRAIQQRLDTASSTAKQLQTEIKRSCDNKLPSEAGFPNKWAFDSLPNDPRAIDDHCGELTTRMNLLAPGDEQVIQENQQLEIKINKLRSLVNNSAKNTRELENNLRKIKSQWLPALESLVQNINVKFAEMFHNLSCAGEVKIVKEGDDDDFEKYGIDILVKFRAEEQLSRLTAYVQSGGERVLTTGVYLMALQSLSSDVPFRCVDEINQGMDANYERRMLEMLIQITTQNNASQYFLLTPKLLPNLQYDAKVTIHTVMNGKHIMKHHSWQQQNFLANARKYKSSLT